MTANTVTPLDVRLMKLATTALLLVLAVMLASTLSNWVVKQPLFAVARVVVVGDVSHSNVPTLRAIVAPRLSGTFLTMDLNETRRAFEAVPWVRHARVQRVFPNELKVTLQQHQAAAYWGAESESTLVNSYGEVFEANVGEVEQDTLPRLVGPLDQSASVLAMYRSLGPVLEGLDLGLEQLELTGRGSWRALLDSGAELELGRGTPDDVLVRTQRFAASVTQVAARYGRRVSALESADLRHEQGYALRLRGVSTAHSGAATGKS